ncbi:intermembrane lipid transfer protein VPS13D isoform X3 [Dendrobates tinctorius]|uniref:intermembrane lipid transfer protein VPS13D isoform X3 n=1 Tax=Dendrobates tinctorius TaxID=92724 RepID=UPI003CC937E5
MLERLVAWVLNTYLGKYVNNLNTDQLSVALLKGAVELENLPLKKDALKELELPFEVKAGFIGKIRIQIPFYRPHLDPWVISISRLHLVGSPDKQEDFDELREKLLEFAHKKALLKALEEKWKSEQEQKGESYWYSVTASIVTRIVDNIELKIQDVHLRFEDGVTYPSRPFAFGVCIKNVSVQNASHEPVERFIRNKQLEIEDFSIYWDVHSTLLGDLPPGELQDAMDKSMESREHQYILEPVCTSALLKRNCSKEPLRSRQQPRIECDICLKTIPLTLSQAQYQQIVEFVDEFERKERQMKYRKWRPKVSVLENCREWWLFALNANLSKIQKQRQRLRLEFLLHRARDAVFYCDKHYCHLQGMQLSAEHEAEMDRIEEEQSFEELKILRQQVHDRFKKQQELAESLREPISDPAIGSPVPSPTGGQGSGMLQYLQSWFPGWGGWYGNPQEAREDIERLTQEQRQEEKSWNPEDILGTEEFFDPTSDAANLNTFTKRDHVFVKLNFHLKEGTITLLHKEKNGSQAKEIAFMQLEFSGMTVRAESLPRRDSSLLLVQLGGLFLRDLATHGTIYPQLVYPNAQKEVAWSQLSAGFMGPAGLLSSSNSPIGEDPVFKMLYEKNPAHSVFERRLEVSTRPLNIIYNPQAITKVADFFYKGKVHSSGFGYQSELELRVAEAARRQYNKLKIQTKAEIRQTIDRLLVGEFIENSRRWTLRLDICAPQVIFPDDFLSKDPVLVVVDLGSILLTNSQAFHILHNTTIQFKLEKFNMERDSELAFPYTDDSLEVGSILKIEGNFVNNVQVVLAKHVYEQVLQTLDNLVYSEDVNKLPLSSATLSSPVIPEKLLNQGADAFNDQRERHVFDTHSFRSLSSKSVSNHETTPFTQVQANFQISELQIQLSGDLTLGAQGLVSLKFQDFDIEFNKDHPHTLAIQIALRSLLMEDLLEKNPDSKYKNLMMSRGAPKPSSLAHKEYLSQSCPLVSHVEYPDMPRSLPSHMEEATNVFQLYQRPPCPSRRKPSEEIDSEYPLTPPPSPTSQRSKTSYTKDDFDESLVHVNVFLVDQKHPEFSSKYKRINRSVNVDFNCLDVLVTLQTWVVILDFFGIGSTADNHALKPESADVRQSMRFEANPTSSPDVQEHTNTKMDLKVHSLSLVLKKTSSELAKASVSKLTTHLENIEGDLALQGSIGSLSLSDLTAHGELYSERFTTSGDEALIFHIFKYGIPDPKLKREYDMRVSLRMASVQYVHTQRFQSEVVSFIQHFTQLQDVLGRQRAAIQGQTVRDQAQRASRILLDIEAGAPVLLIPESSRSNNLIVANLGKLKVKNRFLFSGTSGTFCLKDKNLGKSSSPIVTPEHKLHSRTSDLRASVDREPVEGLVMASMSTSKMETTISSETECLDPPDEHICLLDCIVVDLQDMDIFAAERHPRNIADAHEKWRSDLIFPSYIVRQTGGSLLTERCRLKLQLERNLDKEISHSVPDMSIHGSLSSVHCSLDLSKYKLIKGLLENNLGEPVEDFMRPYDLQDPRIHTVLSGEVYTSVSFLIDMVNVSLELLEDKGKDGVSNSLARFDFKKSKLLFESFSNQNKSINLVSHSMMAFDTRYTELKPPTQKPNVFNCILQPSKSNSNPGSLQIELHHRSTKDTSCFTVVLNNLRVFLIFDWLLLVHKFLQTPSETKKVTLSHQPEEERRNNSASVVPKTVKMGVVTKRSSVQVTPEKQLEVKINVTGTEFVVVEDASCVDTNAIILKGTTVLTYKPKLADRPFSGSLFGIEVFSCRLGNEHDTALSIIDPVHVQIELVGNSTYQNSSGLMDAFNTEDFPPILEIQLQMLDIRLSYNDVQLFLAIAKSIPEQASTSTPESAVSGNAEGDNGASEGLMVKDVHRHVMDPLVENQLARLQELGFAVADCRKALLASQGQLNKAATWLFKNAEPQKPNKTTSGSGAVRWISGVELKADSICICFIDDCMDCDVPLAEITFSRLNFFQHLVSNPDGSAEFTLSGDYYNRELSGWEPFVEPWPCSISWQQQEASRIHPSHLKIYLKAKQRLDINITSVLIEQYVNTKESWMADYCKLEKEATIEIGNEEWMGSSVDPPCIGPSLPLSYLRTRSTASLTNLEHQVYARVEMKTPKRRQPFIPFALRNHTGCTLWFATLTTTPTRAALSHSGSPEVVPDGDRNFFDDAHNVSQWREVPPGEEIPFEFETREKLRHRHTHDLRIHQLQVRVSGWEQVSPVSVDRVGIFFRYAAPDKNSSSSSVGSPISRTNIIHPQVYFSALPPVRVVFAVTMEGSARKVVTVRSSLIVKNKLEIPMELRLDSPSAPDKPVILPAVMPGDSFAIPLHLTSWRLQARPRGMGVFFCKTPIHWTNVTKTGEVSSSKRECHSMDTENSRYFRFCVALRKENYPDYMPSSIFSDRAKQIYRQPGHTVFLLPTVVICNLLPCELNFYVKGTALRGTLKSGKEMALHTADTSQNFELGIAVENFQHCKELLIPPGTQNYIVRMRLYDANKRQLNLTIRIMCRAEGSLKIFISAPYWLINKTGLPLIFRQDNAKTDAAGQFEEHELARSLSPLLFCYSDKELPNLCTMRVGKGIHPDGIPGWCQAFSLDGGSGVRALKVIQQGNRPGLIYNIGIDVKKGRGRYRHTCMVTFAPRYLLINKSSHKLAFAQREFARGQGTNNPEGYISTLSGSSVVFHWPRNDYDQLLCVRLMDVSNCTWSGGFEVNKNNSFHINMRDTFGKCYFLRVEVTLQGATYRVSFSDTDQLPPPFRVDNFSKVPIMFIQHGVAEPRLRTEVKASCSLDYAWDEPILPSYITLTVKGAGSSEIVCNMNDFQDSKQLYYENFIYIAATYTFSGFSLQKGNVLPVAQSKNVIYAELVLDVQPKTLRVLLKKKEPGKRSQLWRMTGSGMLCHEGSSPPHNPNKLSTTRSHESSLVLDIAGLAAVTDNRYEPLMLRKPDRRRSTTQTWCFRDGKLSCSLPGLVVQARNGVSGLLDGAEVVLGPDATLEHMGSVPREQQFINQKMRPGSGVLSVRVIPDGPTRVLQITDFQQRRAERLSSEIDDLKQLEMKKFKSPELEQELEVVVKLQDGIGISLNNKLPEELVFASFGGINIQYMHQASNQVLELHIQNVQVDNQLIGTTQPAMLFVTPKSFETEDMESGPAIQVNAVKVPSKNALTDLYKHLLITAQRFTVQIEEKLLLKLLSYFGFGKSETEVEKWDENIHEKTGEENATPIRYYFENLKISVPQIKLSVFTSNKLPPDLKALKSTLGFPLIKFEDAVIDLDPYTRVHPYESREFLINDVLKHFQEELLSQAAKILGSVDFLGNPMGLLNDVSEGVSGLIKYGNVGGLIRNVTHGVSNSAAKFAGTLSDGLGKTMDNRYQTEREYIRYHAATSGEHLVAGIHGLAHGIIGGLTSVITSTVEGVKNEGGVSGFISGLGKGLVGTVTKPVAGVLDFASETAQAVRDTATLSGHRMQVQRVRRPRCCTSPQGLLPRYSETQAEGQEQLFRLTDNIQDEFFIAVDHIDSYCVLISSKAVYFLKWGEYVDRDAIFLEIKYDDLYHCLVSKDHGKIYVQLTKKAETTSSGIAIPGPSHQKPMVHVKSEALAVKISQEINYAKSLYYEQQLMLRQTEEQENLDLNY